MRIVYDRRLLGKLNNRSVTMTNDELPSQSLISCVLLIKLVHGLSTSKDAPTSTDVAAWRFDSW